MKEDLEAFFADEEFALKHTTETNCEKENSNED